MNKSNLKNNTVNNFVNNKYLKQIDYKTAEMQEIFNKIQRIVERQNIQLAFVGKINNNFETIQLMNEMNNSILNKIPELKNIVNKSFPFNNKQETIFNLAIKHWDFMIGKTKAYLAYLPITNFDAKWMNDVWNFYMDIVPSVTEQLESLDDWQ